MNIFISHSHKDREAVNRIIKRLQAEAHEVWIDEEQLQVGDNLFEKIGKALSEADIVIVVISENSARSEWVQAEFSTIALQQIGPNKPSVFPIRLDEFPIPAYLAGRFYLDFSEHFDESLNQLSRALSLIEKTRKDSAEQPNLPALPIDGDTSAVETGYRPAHHYATELHHALRGGSLTLVCGAGISVPAGVPAWNSLLANLLESMIELLDKEKSLGLDKSSVEEFQKRFSGSSLITGKYLKNVLRNDFSIKVREALYSSNPVGCTLIDRIVDLARPQREGHPLDSIITFNFDGLIEENLNANNIPNKPIYSESVRHDLNQLPIYHVHGYLPRTEAIPLDSALVFSEDAYHNQFLEPFSWSNLIQLNKLTQNTCLFIGISLTDPNMRRLLDVAWRKKPEQNTGHYIVKRRPFQSHGDRVDKAIEILEEQDAAALGLNVIWIDDYAELPELLQAIATG